MPDITLCTGHGCKQRKSCYRFNASPNPFRQSYFASPPFKSPMNCEFYDFDYDSNAHYDAPLDSKGEPEWSLHESLEQSTPEHPTRHETSLSIAD